MQIASFFFPQQIAAHGADPLRARLFAFLWCFSCFDAGKKMNCKKVFLHLSKMLEILLAFCHLRRYTVHAENNPGGVCHA